MQISTDIFIISWETPICVLRWLTLVTSTFQYFYSGGSFLPIFIRDNLYKGIKQMPTNWLTSCKTFFDIIHYHSNTLTHCKHP